MGSSDAHRNRNTRGYRDTDRDPFSHADGNRQRNVSRHGYSNSNLDRNPNGESYRHLNGNAHTLADANRHCQSHINADIRVEPDPESNPDQLVDTYAYVNHNADCVLHGDAHADHDRESDHKSAPDQDYVDTDEHRDPDYDTYGNAHADLDA